MRHHHLLRALTWWLPPTSSLTQSAAPYIRGTLPQTPTSPRPWIQSRLQLRRSPLSPRQTVGMSLRLLLLPFRKRLSRRRLHAPWPRTSIRMSPLSPPCSDEPSPSSTSFQPGVPPSDPDAANSDVPEHLRVLFLTTLQEANLSSTSAYNFRDLLFAHQDVFARSPTDIGFCDLLQHDIDTADAAPIRQPPRRPRLASGTAEDDLMAEMLSAGVIEPSDSPWASPVCLAMKPDGSYWFCVDYRRVNAVSRNDAYPIPDIQDAFDSLPGRNISQTLTSFQAIGR